MKRWLTIGFLAALFISCGLLFGQPAYRRLMAERLLHAAQAKDAAHDSAEATRFYLLALQRDNSSIDVLDSFAAFLIRIRNSQAMAIRARITQLRPDDDGAFLDYVESALAFGGTKTAHGLLLGREKRVGSKINESARFIHLLGTCYFLENDLPAAAAAYSEAAKRDPKNRRYLINKAQLLLYVLDPTIRDSALATLDLASGNAGERQMVLPSLLQYASEAPVEPPQLEDWLRKADGSLALKDGGFPPYLAALKRWRPDRLAAKLDGYTKAAAAGSESALAAQGWLMKNGLCEQALVFRETLPVAIRSSLESLLLTAEAMYQLGRMDELSAFIQTAEWNQSQIFRMAWIDRIRRATARGEGAAIESEANWRRLLVLARDDPNQLSTLANLADDWRWPQEAEMALWAMAEGEASAAEDALRELARRALARGDCCGLRRILDRQSGANPDNPAIANNLAFLCFLLGCETAKATRLSDDLCRLFPKSPLFVSTSAFGRLTKGDIPGGLRLFEKIDAKSLEGTAAGVTYGLLLAADGDPLAAGFLKDAERWTHFPEERELIAEARKKMPR